MSQTLGSRDETITALQNLLSVASSNTQTRQVIEGSSEGLNSNGSIGGFATGFASNTGLNSSITEETAIIAGNTLVTDAFNSRLLQSIPVVTNGVQLVDAFVNGGSTPRATTQSVVARVSGLVTELVVETAMLRAVTALPALIGGAIPVGVRLSLTVGGLLLANETGDLVANALAPRESFVDVDPNSIAGFTYDSARDEWLLTPIPFTGNDFSVQESDNFSTFGAGSRADIEVLEVPFPSDEFEVAALQPATPEERTFSKTPLSNNYNLPVLL